MNTLTFPAKNRWLEISPREAGFDPSRLKAAVSAAEAAETAWPRDLSAGLNADATSAAEPPPWNEVLGPTRDRGGTSGVLLRRGAMVARWGDTRRPDMTFSVAKSYLAILAGIAVGDGLIRCIDDPVRDYALDGQFESAQNRSITWRHLLHQSSEWEGTLWDKPDWIDRNRQVGTGQDNRLKGSHRELRPPGTFYEYNDVRVNRLSLSLLQVFRRPLADVLKERVMDPIGASDDWEWLAYRNAQFEIDGVRMPSVPGGAHWGGGIFIGTEDHARMGLLVMADGTWNGERILPEGWVTFIRTPSPTFTDYGALWWLNHNQTQYPSAPASSFFAMGAGTNLIWVDQSLDLVAVLRWIDKAKVDQLLAGFMAALQTSQTTDHQEPTAASHHA